MSVLPRLVLGFLAAFAVATVPTAVTANTAVKAKPAAAARAKPAAAPAKPVVTVPAERFPLTGTPAFEVTPLPGWKLTRSDPDNIHLASADTAASLIYLTWEDAPGKSRSDDEIAGGLFSALGSAPPARKEPISIGGRPGQDYIGQLIRDDGMQIDLHIIVIRIDPHHALIVASMSQFGDGGTGQAQAKAQLAKTRVVIK